MTSASGSAWGNGDTYQSQNATGPYSQQQRRGDRQRHVNAMGPGRNVVPLQAKRGLELGLRLGAARRVAKHGRQRLVELLL